MMWRMFGWLGKAAAAALLVSFLAIWTTGYIVNSYVETLIRQYNLPLETRPFALSGLWGTLWGVEAGQETGVMADSGNLLTPQEGRTGSEELQGNSQGGAAGRDDGGTSSADPEDPADRAPNESGYGSALPDDADGEDGSSSSDAPGGTGNAAQGEDEDGAVGTETGSGTGSSARGSAGQQAGEAIVTPEEMTAAREQLSEDDRNKLFAILVTKLPQEEWQTISGYVEGGLTGTELMDVQQIVAKYLNDAEYDELMEILSKY